MSRYHKYANKTQAEASRRVVPTQEATVLKPLLKRAPSGPQYNDSRFVRKRPKAPNPLSCKPKVVKERVTRPSKKEQKEQSELQQQEGPTEAKARTRKRVRKAKQDGDALAG